MKGVRVVRYKSGNIGFIVVLRNIYYGTFETIEKAEEKCVEITKTLTPIIKIKEPIEKRNYKIYIHHGSTTGETMDKFIEVTMSHKVMIDNNFKNRNIAEMHKKVYKLNKQFKNVYAKNMHIIQRNTYNNSNEIEYSTFKTILSFKCEYCKKELIKLLNIHYDEIQILNFLVNTKY